MPQLSRGWSPLPTGAGGPGAQGGAPSGPVVGLWTFACSGDSNATGGPSAGNFVYQIGSPSVLPTVPFRGSYPTKEAATAAMNAACLGGPSPQQTPPPSGGTPAGGTTTPTVPQSGGGEAAASGLCANLGYIPPCVGGWPTPQRPATDGTCDKWVSFVGQIVNLGKILLQSSGEGSPSRLDSNWVKNVVCACVDFDPSQLRGMPPLEYLYAHVGQCDFSEAYLAIASTVHGLNGGQLQAAYAVKAALEALASIEYGVNTGYAQDQGEGQHSELGLGI